MKKKVIDFFIEIRLYRNRFNYGMIAIILLSIIGAGSYYSENILAVWLLVLIWPIISIILWMAVNVASARIIQANAKIIEANQKLEEKNGNNGED